MWPTFEITPMPIGSIEFSEEIKANYVDDFIGDFFKDARKLNHASPFKGLLSLCSSVTPALI